MALFNSKANKKDETAAAAPAAMPKKKAVAAPAASASVHALIGARITEKATELAAKNVYAFNVRPDANKRQVSEAVRALYKVTPVSIRILQVPTKRVRHAKIGVIGTRSAEKKAYVELKKGDTISLM